MNVYDGYTYNAGLEVLAQYPNVYCKVSGLFTADKSWTVQTFAEKSAKPCMEIFGMDRYIVQS